MGTRSRPIRVYRSETFGVGHPAYVTKRSVKAFCYKLRRGSRPFRYRISPMPVFGYARVSATDQDLNIQEAALRAAGCDMICGSASKADPPVARA